MKRIILSISLLVATALVNPQLCAISGQVYRHTVHPKTTPTFLVSFRMPTIHEEDIDLKTAIAVNGDRIFYLHAETTNFLDYGSKIFLGTDAQGAMLMLRALHSMLDLPDGTRDTIPNDGYTCYLLVRDDPSYGKLLITRRVNDGGIVTLNDEMLTLLEDAFSNYDEETVSCFPHIQYDNKEDIKGEISRYRSMLWNAPGHKDATFYYVWDFRELFKQRIKEYQADLRAMRRR